MKSRRLLIVLEFLELMLEMMEIKFYVADVHLEFGVYETAQLIKLAGAEKTVYPGESVEFDLKINKNMITSKGQVALILDYGHNSKLEGSVIEVDP